MPFAHHLHDPCPHCPCGCVYWEDLFPGSTLNGHWSVDRGSASVGGNHLTLAADSALSSNVLSTDGTPYGVVLGGVNLPAGSPAGAAIRLLSNYTDPDNYAFAEYRGDGTVHVGTRSGGTDSYGGTWFQADVPILGTDLGGSPLTGPLPFQLCYQPDGIIATAQYRADGFDASQVGAGMTATVASSKCGIATNAAATLGAVIYEFRLSQSAFKQAGCAACAPACGQWQYSDIDAMLSYSGLCNMAPEQFILDLGGSGLANGVTGLVSQGVAGVNVTGGGSGYNTIGTITVNFSGGGGSGATAVVSGISGDGRMTSIYVTNEGSGYTSAPAVTFSDSSGGTGATATAALGPVYVPQPCSGCSGVSGEYTLEFCPWDASGADHDPAPWANAQCYPARPVPPAYDGAPNVPGGQCKWCYYGATALCDNDTLFQAGLGIFPVVADSVLSYLFQVDLYIASLPIPNTYNSQFYNVMNWQAHYQSAAFDLADYPNCTDPFGAGSSLELSLINQSALNLFGGPICGNPWPSVTVRY